MKTQTLMQDLQERVGALLRTSPAADLERNLKAMLAQAFQRLDLVTRDEFDTLAEVLAGLRTRIEALEAALAQYEAARVTSPLRETEAAPGQAAPGSGPPKAD